MAMDLDSCCRLAQDILGVDVTPLDGLIQQSAFCTRNQFHPAQTYLLPQQFGRMLDTLADGEILCVVDLFRVRYLFFRLQGVPVGIGPFCTDFFSLSDCRTLLQQNSLRDLTAEDLMIRRGMCPVQPESNLMHLARSLARALGLGGSLNSVRRLELGSGKREEPGGLQPRRLYAELVNKRYQLESLFMDYIRRGDANAAIHTWRELHHAVDYTKRLGQNLEVARMSAAVNRTTIRLAAAEAGIPALVNDLLSGESRERIRTARSIDEIDAEHIRIIRAYCQAIRERRDHSYSSLVLSAIYQLEHHYAEHITIQEMAEELDVSPTWLTSQFRKETGKPPVVYLNEVRMREAARLLSETRLPVNQVSAQVGILDTNYFIKLFKRAYGQTPLAYRHSHHI